MSDPRCIDTLHREFHLERLKVKLLYSHFHQLTALFSPPAATPGLDAALVSLQLRVEGEVGDGVVGAVCPHAVLGRCEREMCELLLPNGHLSDCVVTVSITLRVSGVSGVGGTGNNLLL